MPIRSITSGRGNFDIHIFIPLDPHADAAGIGSAMKITKYPHVKNCEMDVDAQVLNPHITLHKMAACHMWIAAPSFEQALPKG